MTFQDFIKNLTKEDLELINIEFKKRENKIPTYQYSKIRDIDLENIVDIEKNLDNSIFDNWFNNNITINSDTEKIFIKLIKDNELLIDSYSEEDLKINFIVPILNKVHFKSYKNKFRDFYELALRYETDNFIFNGTVDFAVSSGLVKSKKPYFFIQEFKKSEDYGNPRPQLLAELISAVELNSWKFTKGAYIVGANWHFVILEKLGKNKYQYFVSQNFDSTKIEYLKDIYKNLLFIKDEIITKIKNDK